MSRFYSSAGVNGIERANLFMQVTTELAEEVACDVKWVELVTGATDKCCLCCYNLLCPLHLHVLDGPAIKIKCVANF